MYACMHAYTDTDRQTNRQTDRQTHTRTIQLQLCGKSIITYEIQYVRMHLVYASQLLYVTLYVERICSTPRGVSFKALAMSKEAFSCGKRGLFMWQKRPMHMTAYLEHRGVFQGPCRGVGGVTGRV